MPWTMILLAVVVAGCGGDEPQAALGETVSTTTVLGDEAAQNASEPPCDAMKRSQSRGEFDSSSGTYAALVNGMSGRNLQFDVVEWLSGADAEKAYR